MIYGIYFSDRPFIRKVSDYLTVSVVPFVLFLTVSLSTVAQKQLTIVVCVGDIFLGGVKEDLLRSLRFPCCGSHSLSRIIFCPTRVFRYIPHFLMESLRNPVKDDFSLYTHCLAGGCSKL